MDVALAGFIRPLLGTKLYNVSILVVMDVALAAIDGYTYEQHFRRSQSLL